MDKTKIRGSTIFYEDIGDKNADTVLMVHGHPFDHTMWKYQWDYLKNYHIITPDLRGYGVSDHLFDKIFIEEQALDLALLLDQLNIQKVHLLGLSMGGQIIVEFYRLFPHKVQSMIICASSPKAETEISYQNRLELAERLQNIGMDQYTEEDIHKYLSKRNFEAKTIIYQHLFAMMCTTSVEGAVASHRGRAERRDNFMFLQNIKIPTLVIAGKEDYFFPVLEVKEVADQIPNSIFKVFDESGHLPNMEESEEFNKVIKKFLDSNRNK